jgi:beta-glucosidase
MNAYNKLNGTYCAENKWLLTDVLRNEWGFDGVVVTDWGAENEIVDGIKAGKNLEMPSSGGLGPQKIINAVNSGELDINVLDKKLDSIIELILNGAENLHSDYPCDMNAHHTLARKIASESMVLLKN